MVGTILVLKSHLLPAQDFPLPPPYASHGLSPKAETTRGAVSTFCARKNIGWFLWFVSRRGGRIRKCG